MPQKIDLMVAAGVMTDDQAARAKKKLAELEAFAVAITASPAETL